MVVVGVELGVRTFNGVVLHSSDSIGYGPLIVMIRRKLFLILSSFTWPMI